MDSARQVIRWSIPGLLFFANLVFLNIALKVFGLGRTVAEVLDSFNHGSSVVAGVIASGIPLGFVLYQIYYFGYGPETAWGSPRIDRGGWFFAGLDPRERRRVVDLLGLAGRGTIEVDLVTRTRRMLGVRTPALITEPAHLADEIAHPVGQTERVPYVLGQPVITNKSDYRRRFYFNLQCAQGLLHHIERVGGDRNPLAREYQTLSDLYHGLGAARTAVFAAAVTQATIVLLHMLTPGERFSGSIYWQGPNEWWLVVTGLVLAFMLAAELVVLHLTRSHVWFNLCTTVQLAFKAFVADLPAARGEDGAAGGAE